MDLQMPVKVIQSQQQEEPLGPAWPGADMRRVSQAHLQQHSGAACVGPMFINEEAEISVGKTFDQRHCPALQDHV